MVKVRILTVVFRRVAEGQDMIVGDILCPESVSQAVKNANVVYDFAALADLNEGMTRPVETIRVNILGNAHILEACRTHGVERFVYAVQYMSKAVKADFTSVASKLRKIT